MDEIKEYDNLPYVYKLTHKGTGQFYIGYREANKLPSNEDLGIEYFTSSKDVKLLGFHNFSFEIIKEFHDVDREMAAVAAYDLEQSYIFNNRLNDLCINRQYILEGNKRFRSNAGHPHTEETKRKLSAMKIGIPIPESRRLKMIGRKLPDDVKNKMKLVRNDPDFQAKHKKNFSDTHKENIGKSRAKRFRLVSPEGVVYEGLNVSEFCKQQGLNRSNVITVCSGKAKLHKGWSGEYV